MEKESDFDTSIRVKDSVRIKLDSLKIHPNQSYNELIERLIEFFMRNSGGEEKKIN